MRKYVVRGGFLLFLLSVGLQAAGQDISNVRSFQEDKKAVIVYDLLSSDPRKEFYVKLYCSTDGGKSFGSMLTAVTGDANGIVKAGRGKMAVWDVMKESNSAKGEFVFRLDAASIGANGSLPTYEGNNVTLQFIDIARSGNDVVLKALLNNRNPLGVNFIFANFLVVDDGDRICREFAGDINKMVTVELNTKKLVTFIVKGVDAKAKAFSQFDFSGSGLVVKLKNVPISGGN